MMPLAAARSITLCAAPRLASPASAFLVSVLMRVLATWLRKLRFTFWRNRFFADARLGIRLFSPSKSAHILPGDEDWCKSIWRPLMDQPHSTARTKAHKTHNLRQRLFLTVRILHTSIR